MAGTRLLVEVFIRRSWVFTGRVQIIVQSPLSIIGRLQFIVNGPFVLSRKIVVLGRKDKFFARGLVVVRIWQIVAGTSLGQLLTYLVQKQVVPRNFGLMVKFFLKLVEGVSGWCTPSQE